MDDEVNDETTTGEAPETDLAETATAVADPVVTDESVEPSTDAPVAAAADAQSPKKWYVVKVQSGREDSIRGALERRIKLENLEPYVGRIVVPVEKVTEVRDGKRRIKKVKKFPGYLFCEVEFNEHVLYLFRETSGVGDFVGGSLTKLPQPMSDREVQRMLSDQEELSEDGKTAKKETEEVVGKGRIKLDYDTGDTVKVREGMFANMEGPVKEIADRDSQSPKVKVVLTIWGRPVEVDLDYWQVDRV